jgi:hypothetical protein
MVDIRDEPEKIALAEDAGTRRKTNAVAALHFSRRPQREIVVVL